MKHLYDSLRQCAKEEEVKAEFCKFFKMKIFALRGIDHYTEQMLFEFKYDRNFRAAENVARALAQTMYYVRMLKFGAAALSRVLRQHHSHAMDGMENRDVGCGVLSDPQCHEVRNDDALVVARRRGDVAAHCTRRIRREDPAADIFSWFSQPRCGVFPLKSLNGVNGTI